MYKLSEPNSDQLEMFNKSLPFGDKLNRKNRWIRLAELIDWQRFESIYAKTFSTTGRPGIRARYVLGSLILKHRLEVSDEELLLQLSENPYLQYFIGLEKFSQEIPFDASTLTHVRQRLGDEEFKKFEQTIIDELVERKILKPRNLQIDATVFESDITYPTDCGLLNKAREYCVKQIKKLGKVVEQKTRTYCRVAKKEYLNFSKKKRKTKKQVRKMQKKL
ncbi:transposase [candidate division KSB1 bacterium]|nr:transposase [candidate division KSB1 bacterium]